MAYLDIIPLSDAKVYLRIEDETTILVDAPEDTPVNGFYGWRPRVINVDEV